MVLVTAVLVVLIGMAGFAVDLGWLYYRAAQAQKAAESAALAGVVHMPSPTGVAWPATLAYGTAIDVADRAGYETAGSTTVTPTPVLTHSNRLTVTVETQEPTFFMRVFGIDTISFTRSATAETLPPLRLGSDEAFLGEDPECDSDPTCANGTRDTNLWLAVNGDRSGKGSGDAYTSECTGPSWDCTGANLESKAPSYYYAVDVPQSEVGKSLQVQLYDPGHAPGGVTNEWEIANVAALDFRVRLYEPDQTPGDPTDNSTLICETHYRNRNHSLYDPATSNTWVNLCGPQAAKRGIYVVELTVSGDTSVVNAFSLRARVDGWTDANVAVYGLGAMSIWNRETGSTSTIPLVRLDPVYAGTQLIIELWDVGDLQSPGTMEFIGALGGVECEVRIRDEHGNTLQSWHADDGGSGCRLDIDVQEHNNQWLDFKFDVPSSHSCSGDGCWSYVKYSFGGATTDRTTWTARINGGPIHLVP